jgi:hypothetical protein
MFFDDAPSPENAIHIVNAFSLVSALLLSVLFSIPGSFSLEELDVVNSRFYESGCDLGKNSRTAYGANFSNEVLFYYYIASSLLTASLLGSIMLYALLASAPSPETRRAEQAHERWWKYARFPTLFTFLTLLVGGSFTFIAFSKVAEIKFPQPWNACAGPKASGKDKDDGYMDFNFARYFQVPTIWFAVGIVCTFLSLGTYARYKCLVEEGDDVDEACETQSIPPMRQ